MKFIAIIAALVATAFAQTISLSSPAANSTVYPGQYVTVEVDKGITLTPSTEVALVLTMTPCPSAGCDAPGFDPTQSLGSVLYNGPYNPQLHPEAGRGKPPHQNFSIPVPTSYTPGQDVVLVATHLNLVGAGPFASLEYRQLPLKVVAQS